MSINCNLCASPLPKAKISEGGNFCCQGCRVVFSILEAKGITTNFQDHPLFIKACQAGIISHPLPQKKRAEEGETIKFHCEITNMWCTSCALAIAYILESEKGIHTCYVDYTTDIAYIEFNPKILSKERIFSLLKEIGYEASTILSGEKKKLSWQLWSRFGVACFSASNIMMLSYPLYSAYFGEKVEGYESLLALLSFLFSLPLIFYSAFPLIKKCKISLKTGRFGMETLVVVSVFSAFFYSLVSLISGDYTHLYFDSMSMIIVLVLLGKILESRAKLSVKESLISAMSHFVKKARVKKSDGSFLWLSLKEVKKGDLLFVKEGEKIFLDGVVVEGDAIVDESIITGESIPVPKKREDFVLGGSHLKKGNLLIEATTLFDKSFLVHLLEDVGYAMEKKPSLPLVDKITSLFVPAIFLLSILSFVITHNFLQAISILLIACPCSIGIAAPLAETLMVQKLGMKGVLVRRKDGLMSLTKKLKFVFDKTGTITEGKFKLLTSIDALSCQQKVYLKSLATISIHPVAAPLVDTIEEATMTFDKSEQILGRGVKGRHGERTFFLGSKLFLEQEGVIVNDSDEGTTLYFCERGHQPFPLKLGDVLRKDIDIVKFNPILLSGDREAIVAEMAKKCGIVEWHSECDPYQKKEIIENLKKEYTVIMVGDGANDALALASSDIGITFASSNEMTTSIADVLFTHPDFRLLDQLIDLARKMKTIVRQNLFFSFFYNTIGMTLALFGKLTPFFAALAMVASSLFVTLNALRLNYNCEDKIPISSRKS